MPSDPPPDIRIRTAEPSDALCVSVLAMQVFLDTYATDGIRPDLAREVLAHYDTASFERRIRDAAVCFLLAERALGPLPSGPSRLAEVPRRGSEVCADHLLGFAECAAGAPVPEPSLRGGMELVRLYVQRRAQRHGVGRALLARVESLAHGRSAPHVWLTAWSGNANALAFYAAQGYVDIGATAYVFEDRAYENRVLRKSLRGAD